MAPRSRPPRPAPARTSSPWAARGVAVLSAALLAPSCGRPPVPLEPGAERPTPQGHSSPAARGALPTDLRVDGTIRLAADLASEREGRLFVFVRDAHSGTLILNRAYELDDPAFETGEGGERLLAYELGPEDQLGDASGSDGHLTLEVRLDEDGEVLSSDDVLAVAREPFDAGQSGVDVVLTPHP